MTRRIGPRVLLGIALVLFVSGVIAPAAPASFHFMKISEVFSDAGGGTGNDDFIELQMYSAGQNFVSGHFLRHYNPDGTTAWTHTITGNVTEGGNQRTILFRKGGSLDPADFDDITGGDINPAGGAICFLDTTTPEAPIDCVSWGTWTGAMNATVAAAAGSPAAAMNGTQSLTRSISPNCPTLLDDADDTSNSAADFSLQSPSPRLNATTPTETACTTLQILRAGTGTGSVSGNGSPPIACPPTCFSFFQPAQTAMLVATPGANSTFTNWTNCPTPSGMDCAAPMNMSRAITANFAGPPPTVTPPTTTPAIPATDEDPCAALRAKLKKANSTRKKRKLRKQLRKLGC